VISNLQATALTDELILGAAVLPGVAAPAQLAVESKGLSVPLEARFLWLPDDLVVFAARLPDRSGRVCIRSAGGFVDLGEVARVLVPIEVLARERLAALDPPERRRICDFATSTLLWYSASRPGLALNRRLAWLNSLLRERQPMCAITHELPHGLAVEVLVAVDERSFYARGWFTSRDASPARLTAVSPEGSRSELLGHSYRYPRLDVAGLYRETPEDELVRRSGFAAHFELEAPSLLDSGWIFELEDAAGDGVETAPLTVVRDPVAARNTVLGDLVLEPPYEFELVSRHAHPAISKLQAMGSATVEVAHLRDYGPPVEAAEISIVVPLYGRTDLMQCQLAQFAHDAEFLDVDLIYVLDSPELARALDYDARQLYELYRVPFRVAVLRRNSGYSAANNVGASIARGRLLLLLNSDVLPDRPGWLGSMTAFHDATPGIGALGAKLLYEDETIQHAGIAFSRDPSTQLIANEHVFKGMHRTLDAANVPRPVAGVTGACLLLDRELYHRVGGLQGAYVQGDFEDTDLCSRLAAEGLQNWFLPSAELYHLEGQSYPGPLRALTSRYNAWLHTELWGATALGDPHNELDLIGMVIT
jgi:GT2 family glycosyltransferase